MKTAPLYFLLMLILVTGSCDFKEHKIGLPYSSQAEEVRKRLKETNYNKEYCVLVDFSLNSGKKRMFLYNLKTDKIEESLLVAHGDGCGETDGTPKRFSNAVNSNCSSEGMAVIKERAYSNWGINIKYWLQGLDISNNNMRKRVVVLHSWGGIPDIAIYPLKLIQSQGCFTISNQALLSIDNFIKGQQNNQIILYAFKS